MATSVYTSMLIKDFRRKAGEIKSIRNDLKELVKVVLEMERERSALLIVIQSRQPDFIPSSVKTIATVPKVLGLKWNRLTILVLEAIRVSEKNEAHIQTIVDYVINHGEIEVEDRRSRTIVYNCVNACLKRLNKRGRVNRSYNNTKETIGLWHLPSII